MQKYADPKNDIVFKKLFGEEKNKDLLIDFINKLLPHKKVKDLEYIPTNIEPDLRVKKQSILDVLCYDENGSKYIIEMQNAKEKGFEKRAIYYAAKTYSNQMDKSGKYSDLKEVIFIAITDFVMFPEKQDYISNHSIRDDKTYSQDLKDFSFAFIELPKFNLKDQTQESGIELWCDLFKYAKDRKDVTTADPVIKKAYSTLEMSNWSEQDLIDYDAYQKILLDYQAREDFVREEGEKSGVIKGEKAKAVEIARNLLSMKLDIDVIVKATGLTKDEITTLKSQK